MDLLKVAEQAFAGEKKEFPAFKAGDQITVGYRIKEGNKERVQEFRGDVICIESITINKYGKVRRAKLYYLRERTGKKARIQERRVK